MGNRAVITTPEREIGLYLHWNGGRDTVEPLLRYCELKGYRAPSTDCYGWARIAQVVGNFFGGTTSVGVCAYTDDKRMNPGDNGIYVIADGASSSASTPMRALWSRKSTTSTRCSAHSTNPCRRESSSASSSIQSRSRHRISSSATLSGCRASTESTPSTPSSPSMTTERRSWRATTTTVTGRGILTTASRERPSGSPSGNRPFHIPKPFIIERFRVY